MRAAGVPPNAVTFNALLRAHCTPVVAAHTAPPTTPRPSALAGVLTTLAAMGDAGVRPGIDTYNTLMGGALARGAPAAVPRLFRCALRAGATPDALSWTTLVAALGRLGRADDAVAAFARYEAAGDAVAPVDGAALAALVDALARAGALARARAPPCAAPPPWPPPRAPPLPPPPMAPRWRGRRGPGTRWGRRRWWPSLRLRGAPRMQACWPPWPPRPPGRSGRRGLPWRRCGLRRPGRRRACVESCRPRRARSSRRQRLGRLKEAPASSASSGGWACPTGCTRATRMGVGTLWRQGRSPWCEREEREKEESERNDQTDKAGHPPLSVLESLLPPPPPPVVVSIPFFCETHRPPFARLNTHTRPCLSHQKMAASPKSCPSIPPSCTAFSKNASSVSLP